MRRILPLLAAALFLFPGCEYYAKPNRPLPPTFSVRTLEGTALGRSDFAGKPWVINLWAPG